MQRFRSLAFTAVLAVATVALVIALAVRGDSSDNGGGCAAVYSQHLRNAREFGYPPDDRASFIDRCEAGGRDLVDAGRD